MREFRCREEVGGCGRLVAFVEVERDWRPFGALSLTKKRTAKVAVHADEAEGLKQAFMDDNRRSKARRKLEEQCISGREAKVA